MAAIVAFRRRPLSRRLFLARGPQKREILFEHVLDAEEHVAESGLRASAAPASSPCAAIDAVIACTM